MFIKTCYQFACPPRCPQRVNLIREYPNRYLVLRDQTSRFRQGVIKENANLFECRKTLEMQTELRADIPFESPAEISALERLGADTVGMTLGPESRLISESGIPHVALACSSNWAAGRDPTDPRANIDHHSVDRLASTMRELVTYCIKSLLIEYTK